MPRPKKQTVDYFPHYVAESKTKFMLEKHWGNDGYAFWFKLLELLCRTNGHVYSLENTEDLEYFIDLMGVSGETARNILDKLSRINKIDADLWNNRHLIWCDELVNNLKSVYDKRSVDIPQKPEFSERKPPFSERKPTVSEVSDSDNPQSKVNESKVNESKGECVIHTPAHDKKFFGEFGMVMLTAEDYQNLIQRMGKVGVTDYINRLDCWLAEDVSRKKPNHYATILRWWAKDNPNAAEESLDPDEYALTAKQGPRRRKK